MQLRWSLRKIWYCLMLTISSFYFLYLFFEGYFNSYRQCWHIEDCRNLLTFDMAACYFFSLTIWRYVFDSLIWGINKYISTMNWCLTHTSPSLMLKHNTQGKDSLPHTLTDIPSRRFDTFSHIWAVINPYFFPLRRPRLALSTINYNVGQGRGGGTRHIQQYTCWLVKCFESTLKNIFKKKLGHFDDDYLFSKRDHRYKLFIF